MSTHASVVVIGGGVIGASVAFHLAKQGVRDVTVIERSPSPGAGSTGRATGGFRAQFATPINVQLSLHARQRLLDFQDETGVDPGFSQVGYLWLASTESQLEALRTAQRMQKEEGLAEAAMLNVDELQSVNGAISIEGIAGAAFCATDGYIRPLEILRGYLEAGQRLGASIRWGVECREFRQKDDGSIESVITSDGEIHSDHFVNAAGPWAGRIAAMAGVDLPVVPVRRQAAVTEPCPQIPATMPMTIFLNNSFHARIRDGRALLCWPNPEPPGEPQQLHADPEWIDAVRKMTDERMPALRDVRIDRSLCYAGLYEVSPDEHAIVGVAAECENMYLANGSSGHGVMHSPVLGAIIADLVTGRAPEIDVSILRPSRFLEGAAIKSVELI